MRVCVCSCGSRSPSRGFRLSSRTSCQVTRHPTAGDAAPTVFRHLPSQGRKLRAKNVFLSKLNTFRQSSIISDLLFAHFRHAILGVPFLRDCLR